MSKPPQKPSPVASSKFVPDNALSRPSEQHTVLTTCQGEKAGGQSGCKRQRWCKPQDAWQVKLCLVCRDIKKAAKTAKQLEGMKAKAEVRATIEHRRLYIARLQVLKYIWPTPKERAAWAKGPRLRRCWP